MIKGLAISTVWVLDQDRAKEFYTEKLGLGRVSRIFAGPERLVRHLAALSESSKYVQYEDDPPPCDVPHQTPRAHPRRSGKHGLELRTDMTLGDGGMRWVTVGAKDQPEVMLTLMVPGPPAMDEESAQQVKKLVAKGLLGAGVLATDDVHADYATLKARGVEFLQPPQERPYGTEAILRDDSGNWFSFTQAREGGLDLEQEWSH